MFQRVSMFLKEMFWNIGFGILFKYLRIAFWEKHKVELGYEFFKTAEEFNGFQHFIFRIMHNSISILYFIFLDVGLHLRLLGIA